MRAPQWKMGHGTAGGKTHHKDEDDPNWGVWRGGSWKDQGTQKVSGGLEATTSSSWPRPGEERRSGEPSRRTGGARAPAWRKDKWQDKEEWDKNKWQDKKWDWQAAKWVQGADAGAVHHKISIIVRARRASQLLKHMRGGTPKDIGCGREGGGCMGLGEGSAGVGRACVCVWMGG